MNKPNQPQKKARNHGRRAGQRQTSISMDAKILEIGKQMADADRRPFSNFLEVLIEQAAKQAGKLPILVLLCLAILHYDGNARGLRCGRRNEFASQAAIEVDGEG